MCLFQWMDNIVFSKIATILEVFSKIEQNVGLGIFPRKIKKPLPIYRESRLLRTKDTVSNPFLQSSLRKYVYNQSQKEKVNVGFGNLPCNGQQQNASLRLKLAHPLSPSKNNLSDGDEILINYCLTPFKCRILFLRNACKTTSGSTGPSGLRHILCNSCIVSLQNFVKYK